MTECYGEEAAGVYELLCSRNENGDLCGPLLYDTAQSEKYILSISSSCGELLVPGGAGSCSEACSESIIDLDDAFGCCLDTIRDLFTPDPDYDDYGISDVLETLHSACGVTPPGSCTNPITGGAGTITPSTSTTLTAVALLSALFFHFL